MSAWNPEQYLQFRDERTRPAADLAARIRVEAPARVVDLGCGPGNSTQVLRRRWPKARITGLDSSPEMIAAARAADPGGDWVLGDIATWAPDAPCDVVYSNAALQWLPGHAALVRRLFGHVAPGGALALQMPTGAHSPLRRMFQALADDPAWSSRMGAARRALTMEEPHVYYDALVAAAQSVDVWETEYHHAMASADAVVAWITTTGARPFLDALEPGAEQARFRVELTARVAAAYPPRRDGRVLFPFRRVFVVAHAPPRGG